MRHDDEWAKDTGVRRQRADAERSAEAILDAALDQIVADKSVNVTAIARAAGLSRVTLYTHFPTREALLGAAFRRAITGASIVLREVALDDAPAPEVLTRLIGSAWRHIYHYRNLYAVASAALPPPQLRHYHEPVLGRVARLVARGQADGSFRADLPADWLVGVSYSALHLAAEELLAVRLPADQAAVTVTRTVLSVMTG